MPVKCFYHPRFYDGYTHYCTFRWLPSPKKQWSPAIRGINKLWIIMIWLIIVINRPKWPLFLKVNPPKEGKNDSNQNKGHSWLHFPPLVIQGFSELLQIARETQRDLKLHETTGAGEIFLVRFGVSLISPTPVVELPDAPLIHSFNAFSCNFDGYIRPRVLGSWCPLCVFWNVYHERLVIHTWNFRPNAPCNKKPRGPVPPSGRPQRLRRGSSGPSGFQHSRTVSNGAFVEILGCINVNGSCW